MFGLTDKTKTVKRQRGIYAVEFAIVGSVFLITLFMVIEFGRLLYTWNVLDEITRRGARLAAVCLIADAQGIFDRATLPPNNPLDLTTDQLQIQYLTGDGTPIDSPVAVDPPLGFEVIFVRAKIVDYRYQAFFPISLFFDAPAFETTLPAESLGISPPDTGVTEC